MPRKGPRRPQHKPTGKEQFCWSWLRGEKALGLRLEAQGDLAGAAACHCHNPAGDNGRCWRDGGEGAGPPQLHTWQIQQGLPRGLRGDSRGSGCHRTGVSPARDRCGLRPDLQRDAVDQRRHAGAGALGERPRPRAHDPSFPDGGRPPRHGRDDGRARRVHPRRAPPVDARAQRAPRRPPETGRHGGEAAGPRAGHGERRDGHRPPQVDGDLGESPCHE